MLEEFGSTRPAIVDELALKVPSLGSFSSTVAPSVSSTSSTLSPLAEASKEVWVAA